MPSGFSGIRASNQISWQFGPHFRLVARWIHEPYLMIVTGARSESEDGGSGIHLNATSRRSQTPRRMRSPPPAAIKPPAPRAFWRNFRVARNRGLSTQGGSHRRATGFHHPTWRSLPAAWGRTFEIGPLIAATRWRRGPHSAGRTSTRHPRRRRDGAYRIRLRGSSSVSSPTPRRHAGATSPTRSPRPEGAFHRDDRDRTRRSARLPPSLYGQDSQSRRPRHHRLCI